MTELTNEFSICIGLVGHVANGKTTLVKQLSGVNTKKDSKEIKSGKTIKLGYANCVAWYCEECKDYTTTGAKANNFCSICTKVMRKRKISFVDTPGHHSYVSTMIKGATVVDCAIVVVDVRKNELQPQTLEHLAILEALEVKNILIIQNKIDLTDHEQVKANYEFLREELKTTVACHAPIIPASAQSGLGLKSVQQYIYEMCEFVTVRNNSQRKLIPIIRSFDVNREGAEIEELKGGVIGGTPLGSVPFTIGEVLEIRPGPRGSTLKTRITSLFSETESCERTERGGLYGFGTTLDPSITKADGLVGSVAGLEGTLPDVINTISMPINRMKDMELFVGTIYKLVIGPIVTEGYLTKRERRIFTFALRAPICPITNKCILYSNDQACTLLGFGVFETEEDLVSTALTFMPLSQDINTYLSLLNACNLVRKKTVQKHKLPIPTFARDNRDLIWTNLSVFCSIVSRDENSVALYLKEELCMETSVCKDGLRLRKTKLSSTKIESVLKKYVAQKVVCGVCKGMQTEQRKNHARGIDLFCKECGATCVMEM